METRIWTDSLWFTSDHHFLHKRIQELDNEEKHEDRTAFLIKKWNERVKSNDTVWHLGDFSFGGKTATREIFAQLHGQINVLSNHFHHDARWLPRQPVDGERYEYAPLDWESYYGQPVRIYPPLVALEIPQWHLPDGLQHPEPDYKFPLVIILCHYPFKSWDRRHYGSWHLYGHTHQTANEKEENNHSFYVGMRLFNYNPVSFNQIATEMVIRGWSPEWSQYG